MPFIFGIYISGKVFGIHAEMISANYNCSILIKILLFNPVTICANGYRNVFIKQVWFWETPEELRNYVIVLIVMSALAVWAYGKLKKEIPDVL